MAIRGDSTIIDNRNDPMQIGLVFSVIGHISIAMIILIAGNLGFKEFPQQIIYSVTLEGGKRLGGITQVPKSDKSQIAPPKIIEEQPQEKTKAEVKETKPEEKPKEEPKKELPKEEKAEVSIADKKKEEIKPTVAPSVAPKKGSDKDVKGQKEPSLADINKQLQSAVQRYTGESTDAGGEGFGSGALGGNGMGGGIVRPPEFFIYRDLLKKHITSGWRWADPKASLKAVITFRLSINGEISDVDVEFSSGNREFDNSALRAVERANPAPRPPENVYQWFNEVRLIFDPKDLQ